MSFCSIRSFELCTSYVFLPMSKHVLIIHPYLCCSKSISILTMKTPISMTMTLSIIQHHLRVSFMINHRFSDLFFVVVLAPDEFELMIACCLISLILKAIFVISFALFSDLSSGSRSSSSTSRKL